ncbi:penicillin acylase family protein [Sporosarcina sp. P37]|uniref:penicillin acylase family protein n=1 Tax=unclassified Sporosarcina TaxID=2647733 RepID=UPI000A17C342|nr:MULTISPECIES: penicillin acylase family protein [unclassified Sporosarcina]ARK24308.1 penicillin acylase family protein [Sporosarcina sp. P37]PID18413.1 penicillin acylase family protein [Sporosarcina sp. P35]
MGKVRKITLWGLSILSIIIVIAVIFANAYISKSRPLEAGEQQVSFIDDEVVVARDKNGVPHIHAASDEDLYRAQGYVQAQDRLFQMDLARRQASGRLAEVIGEKAVDTDKLFRTFSLRSAAEASYDGYGEHAKKVLGWYAEGVNAFIEEAKSSKKLSYEFALLGYEPEEWTPVDSLTIGKYMAYDLGGRWQPQAFRHWAIHAFPEEKMKDLFLTYPENAESIMTANKEHTVEVAGRFLPELSPPEFNGSNNWVVSGKKTASGKPLLADDPHLGLSTPSIWYQMHLQSPKQNVEGVIFAGIPGIILGNNEDIAWGVTNVGPDVQDLYIEVPHPSKKGLFRYDGQWEKAEIRNEIIQVKGGEEIPFEVIVTRHGPIISDVMYKKENPGASFSMQWTALEPTLELEAIMEMNTSSDWNSFEKALEKFHAPAQNFVFASTDGTIAYKANGRIPIRKQGDAQLAVPGDSSKYGWKGYVPYDELPTIVNPEEGFIATANNEVADENYPYHITKFWAQPYRFERIVEVLREKDDFTVEDMMKLQMDQKNLYAAEFLDAMIDSVQKKDQSGEFRDTLNMLQQWDQVDSQDSSAPLIFHKWMKQLQLDMFRDEMPADVYQLMPGKNQITDELLRKGYNGEESVWLEEKAGIDQWVYDSFANTMKNIANDFGDNQDKWTWGDYHQLTFPHPLASASPLFEKLLNPKKQPIGGSNITVQAAAFKDDGSVNHGASWRFVADLADLSKTYHIVGPGQSGHMKSKWFHDQAEDWALGNYHETLMTENLPDSRVLILQPKGK